MASWNYEACLKKTLSYEGGYSNHPKDPGGPTKYGITIHDVRKYINKNASAATVKSLTMGQAAAIYRDRYWNHKNVNGDLLPAGVDLCAFDFGVNSGVGRVPAALAAVKGLAPVAAVKKMCAKRLSFLHALKTWSTFGGGWGRRVRDVEATGVKMALSAAGKSAPEVKKDLQKEADASKAKRNNAVKTGTVATGGAGGTQVPDTPVQVDVLDLSWLPQALITVAVVAGVIAVAWFVYKHHTRNKAFEEAAKNV